jgi:leukotriene-A4 hydrolase
MTTMDPLYESRDFSSFSNFAELEVRNIKLEWDLNFETRVISGLVEHELLVKVGGVSRATFDTSNLAINGDIFVNGQKTTFSFGEKNDALGTPLHVDIPEAFRGEGIVLKVLIFYATSPSASAVQWLEPGATKGKIYPYVFTQSQAIHARSLLPCMDSPGVKAPYSAIVAAPAWCTILMSAVQVTETDISLVEGAVSKPTSSESSSSTFYWKQPVATSAYLIALAGGNLSSRDVSDRVRIWSEPEVVDAARYEFEETEEFLRAAEEITGCPYQWGRYDVICLPPSFPYGGMENPCLTFATPTLLAGDRSLADVIAHEIAHSWTGNLVTNSVWNHFWLNEGWTVWLERKITSKVKNNVEVGRLSSQIGYQHLKESVQGFAGEDERFTQLAWPLKGEDPDHAFSSVPYEKGFNLLNYLETIIGTENFDQFAKAYIDKFKFGTVSTGEFRDFFVQFVQDLVNNLNNPNAADEKEDGAGNKRNKRNKKKGESVGGKSLTPSKSFVSANLAILRKVEELDWNALFLTPGMPTYPIDFSNSLANAAHDLAQKWISSRHSHSLSDEVHFHTPRPDMNNWSSQQKCLFLEDLLEASTSETFSINFLANLDRAFGFGSSQNSEIMLRWQQLCIRANCPWIFEPAVNFLTSQGRMKFVRPILRELRRSQIGGAKVAEIFQVNKDSYHPIARKMLGEDLVRIQKEEDEAALKAASSPSKSIHKTSSAQSVSVAPQKVIPDDTVEDCDEADFQDARPLNVSAPTMPAAPATNADPVPAVVTPEKKEAVVFPAGEIDEPVKVNPKVVEVAQEVVEQVEHITTPQASPMKPSNSASAAAALPVISTSATTATDVSAFAPAARKVTFTKVPEPARRAREKSPESGDTSSSMWAIGAVAVAAAAIAAFIFFRPRK